MKQKPLAFTLNAFFSAFLTILLVTTAECAGDRSSRSNRCCLKSVWSRRSGTGYARIREVIR